MPRRSVSPFSLSFLDIMFCGFGAVVLLVLILNNDTISAREQTFTDLRADTVRLQVQVLDKRESLKKIRKNLDDSDKALLKTRSDSTQLRHRIDELEKTITQLQLKTQTSITQTAGLQSDLKKKDARKQQLVKRQRLKAGQQVHTITGTGERQYLTGLKIGGRHILILLDASASMLDETIVNIIIRRNRDLRARRAAPKWQRALKITEWLLSQLPPESQFQLYSFNTTAHAVTIDSSGHWLSAAQPEAIQSALKTVKHMAPQGGTSLYRAFAVVKQFSPRPDNILLITDGLPTQGRRQPASTTVSAEQRLKHFEQAVNSLPEGIPVNTILLPMEGDAWAAAAFWRLAVDTQGSFMAPARDWP